MFATSSFDAFTYLQSRIHEIWVRLTSSTLEDRQGYRPTDCFETFPFVQQRTDLGSFEELGKHYYEARATTMVATGMGLSDTYNRFHDPDERHTDILALRELHDAMDRAVLDAYGWADIKPRCEFLLDYEDEEDEETTSRRKKPWRYRWPDEIRDKVLARLLVLNAERAKQEQLVGASDEARAPKKKRTASKRSVPLFDRPQVVPPTVPVPDHSTLLAGAWRRPHENEADQELAALAAIVKAAGGPTAIRTIRLAQCLAMEPSLLTVILKSEESTIWSRLVGDEARAKVSNDVAAPNTAWGKAVTQLRGTGSLKEDIAAQTWAPGPGLDALYTAGWPDGRAAFILDVLSRRNIEDLIGTLPAAIQEWVLGIAA